SAVLDFDDDLTRPGVERVLDQLLHDRRRSFDHLPGGDAVDQRGRKLLNGPAIHRADYRGETWASTDQRSSASCRSRARGTRAFLDCRACLALAQRRLLVDCPKL